MAKKKPKKKKSSNRKAGKKRAKSGTRKKRNRNPDGTFRKNNTVGRKPKKNFKRDVKSLLFKNFDDKDWNKIFDVLKKQAFNGSLNSIKILLEYSIGRPKTEQDPGAVEDLAEQIHTAIVALEDRGIR